MEVSRDPAVVPLPLPAVTNNVRMCSLFNFKEYSKTINQNNIKISKLMKLNSGNVAPIILQDSERKTSSSSKLMAQALSITLTLKHFKLLIFLIYLSCLYLLLLFLFVH